MAKRIKREQGEKPIITLIKSYLDKMKAEGLTEREVAKRAGLDAPTLSLLKGGQRIANPSVDLRIRLAIAFTNTVSEAEQLAEVLFSTEPPRHPPKRWQDSLRDWKVRLFQTEINTINFGLPLFFDTAPFLIAYRNDYFKNIGLSVNFEYVKWHKSLSYFLQSNLSSDSSLSLTVYNRDSIEDEGKKEISAFCFPLSIYDPKNFKMWVRLHVRSVEEEQERTHPERAFEEAVRGFLESIEGDPKIIVSGSDMKRGVEKMIRDVGLAPLKDECFILVDQFDALEVFIKGLGDAYVGGVAQSMTAKHFQKLGIKVFATGEQINTPHQYNGIVCPKNRTRSEVTLRAICQVLYAWYRALEDIKKAPEKEATFIVEKMNLHATDWEYRPEDFIKFWTDRYFEFPSDPKELQERVGADYFQKFYDETNTLLRVLSELDMPSPKANGK